MQEHAVADAKQRDADFRQYVQSAAAPSSSNTADELARLADLRDKGVISEAEFQQAKAKALG
jgi:multidrug resistance efflux pump